MENDVSQLVVPNHSFAQNRVVTGDDTLLCYAGTMRIDDNGVFDVTYTDWHDNTTHSGSFILDGIIVPSCPDGSCFENPTINLGFINVVRHICGRDGIAVYVDTDGQTDSNGNYHGYIYFAPVIDDVNRGRVIYGEELVQLNEWLLAYGFAAPDHSYYGEYADIYAQYPDFADDFEGYPLMVAAYLTEPNDYNFFFYNPHASTQALSEMGY